MSRVLCCCIAVLVLLPAAVADAKSPWRWPSKSTALNSAYASALGEWQKTPCRGDVKIRWGSLPPGIDGDARWLRDLRDPRNPDRYEECRVVISEALRSQAWEKVCTIVAHEIRHLLTDIGHSDDPADVMHSWYLAPTARCAVSTDPRA